VCSLASKIVADYGEFQLLFMRYLIEECISMMTE